MSWRAAAAGLCALALAACVQPPPEAPFDVGEVVDGATLPYYDAPRTRLAPRVAPLPSARGIAPPPSERIRRFPAPPPPPEVVIGPVCGDPRLRGRAIEPILSDQPGCGIAEPVQINAVAGVTLSAPVRVNCETARRLADWTARGVQPEAARLFGRRVSSMRPIASYVCRPVNGIDGAELSEHARGGAVDIAAFTLEDGETVTVLEDWPGTGVRPLFVQSAWRKACDHFGTVLGPQADAFHADHLHLDTAPRPGGAFCR